MDFKTPEFSQKSAVDRFVREQDSCLCDQTFGNIFCWSAAFDVKLAVADGGFIVRWGRRCTVPIGENRKALLEQLLKAGETQFLGIDDRTKCWMEEAFPGQFSFTELRNNADYIYDRESLENLKGKKLASKRNHIHYFEEHFDWEVRSIDETNLEDVKAFNDEWCRKNHCHAEQSLEWEGCAVRRALHHYQKLDYRGIALYANGKICAFTCGESLGKEGFCVHVEKADSEIRGAYPMVNREFVKTLPPEIRWINREDDTGDEGLRKAKLSYRPAILLMKYKAEVIK
ncbi:MAG: DUF2156 domain-containing protein [Clostridia bacterium]|nr:DUF2156 domain-containing protein [Clostridia bacterium]